MDEIKNILQSKKKPKEKVSLLAKKAKEDKKFLDGLVEYFKIGSTAEKGSCIEAMEYVSQDKPDMVVPFLNFIIENINYNAPRVRWESARVIGNLAPKYPGKASKSIDRLFLNTKDKSTVVRWSAAFALTEIAKNSPKQQKRLISKFKDVIGGEKNSGVKNVYLKALKIIEGKK